MSTIVSRGAGDIRCNIGVDDIVRYHGINVWRSGVKLRIGCRANFILSPYQFNGVPRFGMGLCSGVTRPPMSLQGCKHFIGWGTVGGTWPINGFVNSSYYEESFPKTIKIINSTAITGIGITLNNNRFWSANSGATGDGVMLLFCDITNGGAGNWTIEAFYPSSSQSIDTPTSADFQAQMQLATPTWSKNVYNALSTTTVDEGTDGTLDAFTIFWNRNAMTLDLLDVAVVRLA